MRKKPYEEHPKTLGQHLKKRRLERGLLQREAAKEMGIGHFTYLSWEKDKVEPEVRIYPRIVDFLGFSPIRGEALLRDQANAKRRELGWTWFQLAHYLGCDEGTLKKRLRSSRPLPGSSEERMKRLLAESTSEVRAGPQPPRRR